MNENMKDNMSPIEDGNFIDELKAIVNSARKYAYTAINFAQVRQNWLIGQRIVMQEQKGKARAEYGKQVINMASKALTSEFGKGFSPRSLWKFKQFYLMFNDLPILPTVSAESLGKKMPTMPLLPTEEELRREIERQKEFFLMQQKSKEDEI